jgi:hypothetical protein
MLPAQRQDTTTRATEAQVLQALASLAGLPSRAADDAEMDQRMYFVALENVTRYALSEAVKSVMRGHLGHTFFPSPVELRKLCDEAQRPIAEHVRRERQREEQRRFRAEIDAFEAARTPEARARVAAIYRRFCESYDEKARAEPYATLDPELVAMLPDAPKSLPRSFRLAQAVA